MMLLQHAEFSLIETHIFVLIVHLLHLLRRIISANSFAMINMEQLVFIFDVLISCKAYKPIIIYHQIYQFNPIN